MPKVESFDEATELLSAFIPVEKDITYTLDRVKQLMDFLGNPQNNLYVVHVAGTSGKTSTSYYIAALLRATGRTVGLSISPHVDSISERAQINLQPLEEADYCQEMGVFLDLVEQSGIKPSYFELLVAFMYWLFDRRGVDYAVVEVGLGGLLDGTNTINRSDKVCVITDIGFDHVEILGNTLEKIAIHKAGIILKGNHVFMHAQPDEVMRTVTKISKQRGAHLSVIDEDLSMLNIHHYDTLPLFQKRNLSLAYTVVKYVLNSSHAEDLLATAIETYIPGRMEEVTWSDKTIIMDGSHNAQKITALVDAVKVKYKNRSIALVVSFGKNKAISLEENLRLLHTISSTIIITKFSHGQDAVRRPMEPDVIGSVARQQGFDVILELNPEKALNTAVKLSKDIVLVTGSLYLLNHVRPIVLGKEKGAS